MAAGRLDEAAADAARAVTLGGDAAALEVAGWVAYYRRRYDEAVAYADEGIERATDAGLKVSCLSLAGRVRHGVGDVSGAEQRLEAAVLEPARPEVRGLAGVWLAQVRVHQGRPEEALRVADRALVDPDSLAHPFAPLHGRFVRVLALGQLGRAAEALAACDELDAAVARAGDVGLRLAGPALNGRAWILRWTGQPDQADALNEQALDMTEPTGPRAEAFYAAVLDLADGRLLAGDLDGANAVISRLSPIAEWEGTMAWHHRHRWALARARLAIAEGRMEEAADLSATVASDARRRGTTRYELLAQAVGALAGGAASSSLERLGQTVQGLARCAALDGWPLVAALASRFDSRDWQAEAERRAAQVIALAPDRAAASSLVARLLG
jgi:tetratricopeptide (TPR) repeat protein